MTSEEVRKIRRKLGLTQQALADKLEVTVGAISAWEQGKSNPIGPARVLLRLLLEDADILDKQPA